MKAIPRQGSVGLSALDSVSLSANTSATPGLRTTVFSESSRRVAMLVQNPPNSGQTLSLHTDDVDVIAVLSPGMSWGLNGLAGGLVEDKEVWISSTGANTPFIAIEYNSPAA